eukprot:UN17242
MYRVNRIAPHMRHPVLVGINVEHGELWPHIAIDAVGSRYFSKSAVPFMLVIIKH